MPPRGSRSRPAERVTAYTLAPARKPSARSSPAPPRLAPPSRHPPVDPTHSAPGTERPRKGGKSPGARPEKSKLPSSECNRAERDRGALGECTLARVDGVPSRGASVHAFQHLARELEARGGPVHLQAASRRAARDEIRRARVTEGLAARAGARVPSVKIERDDVRSLGEIAIENAVEGCVRETFGAAVTLIQAERAGDADVRSAMKRSARGETRHAELSWAGARRIEPQRDRDGRRPAIAALMRDACHEPDQSLTERRGVPAASQARAVLDDLKATLNWRPSASSRGGTSPRFAGGRSGLSARSRPRGCSSTSATVRATVRNA
jgi:hypothetical protein